MKTKKNLNLCCRAAALLALMPLGARAAETAGATPDQTNEPPTHVLFTGTDIQVFHHGTMHRVRDVAGGSFMIVVNGQEIGVPMGANPEKLKIARVQTITGHFVSVTKYKYERAFTPAKDPSGNWSRSMLAIDALQEHAGFSETALRNAPAQIGRTEVVDGIPTTKLVENPGVAQAQEQLANLNQTVAGATGYYESERGAALAQELYDVLEVEFRVSSAKPIRSPYMVIMAKFHEKDDPKHPQNWIFAKALDPISSKPEKVSVREGGFPPGFVVDKLEVHLYQNGLEIATDLSENRTPLARDEAHEYFVINHVSRHKTGTLPARVALAKLPEGWATHHQDESFRKTYYVKVDQTGHPVASFEDEACTTKVADTYYEGVLRDLLFLPALEKGKATDGMARVKLNELPM